MRSDANLQANTTRALALAQRALDNGATLVVLPENYWGIGETKDKLAYAFDAGCPESSALLGPMLELSRRTDALIGLGGVPERCDAEHAYNTFVLLCHGRIVASYRKIHRFDATLPSGLSLNESESTAAGNEPVVVHTPVGTLGLTICYDLRFPELYRLLNAAGAEILLVPAAFTLPTGIDHWSPLLRARAIENQAYVMAAAQDGAHGHGRDSFGHSMIIDPWGIVVAQASPGEGVALAHLDPDLLDRVRHQLPTSQHRCLQANTPVTQIWLPGCEQRA